MSDVAEPQSEGQLASEKGRATRKAVAAALKAHIAVLKGKPLRAAISEALDEGGNLGGQERRFVAFAARELSRHQRFLDFVSKSRGQAPGDFGLIEDAAVVRHALWRQVLMGIDTERALAEVALPGPVRPRSVPDQRVREVLEKQVELPEAPDLLDRLATRHSFPTWLARAIASVAPQGELEEVLAALNREPKVMMRARPPGTRAEVKSMLSQKGIATEEALGEALVLTDESRAVFDSGPMKNGRLLVMDEGSQRLCELTGATTGQTVVDYCAGAGGKTIVLADLVGPTGRVLAHDINQRRLAEARRRVGELKLRHVSFPIDVRVADADVVLIDAPCSGTGTLAREPDQKWKLKAEKISEYTKTQRKILDDVGRQAKAGATVVYATCSLLTEENEAVVETFLKQHPEFTLAESLRVWPHRSHGGGFYGARLTKSKPSS